MQRHLLDQRNLDMSFEVSGCLLFDGKSQVHPVQFELHEAGRMLATESGD